MDQILDIVLPHLDAIIAFLAGAVATGLVWLTGRTSTKLDDDFLKKIAEEISKKQ